MLRIDSHHHLWDQSVRPQDWMNEEMNAIIGGPYTLEDWAAVAEPTGVSYGVFVQTVDVPAETPEVLALADGHPQLAAVIGWIDIVGDRQPAGEQLDELLAGPGGERLAGVRAPGEYHPDPEWLDSDDVHALAVALRERDLTLDLLTRPLNLAAASRLAASEPETLMVLNHLSKPSMRDEDFKGWAAAMREVGKHENVACKFSAYLTFDSERMTAERLRPYAEVVFDAFGPKRVMFGSDWPVNVLGGGYAAAVKIAEELLSGFSDDERASIWAGTARRFYPALDRSVSALSAGA